MMTCGAIRIRDGDAGSASGLSKRRLTTSPESGLAEAASADGLQCESAASSGLQRNFPS